MVTRLNEAHKALILVALYAMVTVVGVMYRKDMIETDVAMLFLLLNILSASVLKPRNAYLMMGLSIIDYHYFLLPDYQSFRFENAQYVITYAVLAFSGIFAVNITQAQRKQIEKNKRLQQQHKKYYELACHLSALSTSEDIAQATVKFLSKEKGIVSAIALYQPQWQWAAQHPDFPVAAIELPQPISTDSTSTLVQDEQINAFTLVDRGTTLGAIYFLRYPHDRFASPEALRRESKIAPWVRSLLTLSLARAHAHRTLANVEAEKQLESTRTTLLASVSHDLKTPLGAIIGSATTLTDPSLHLSTETQQELLTSIAEQGERLNRSLTKLLDITRYTASALVPKLDWVEPEELIGTVLSRLAPRLTHHKVQIESQPMLVELDSLLIEQVLINLVENAAKYTPRGSEIEIACAYQDQQFTLAVMDNGAGIPDEALPRIFDRFYRVEGNHADGTGLGLAICQVIVAAHQGSIRVHNRESGGACFTVTIPCRQYNLKELYEQ